MTASFLSHAQNFEDVRLWRAFSDIAQGRYLDIGAQDPVIDSVSLAFYERGWRGMHVEPTPTYASAMRAARPDETVIEAAVSSATAPIQFFEIPESGISTGICEVAENHARSGYQHRIITVPTVTLADLFTLMGEDPIHWLKIDVEGMEADVLASWGDHSARPAALVIEATAPCTQIPTHHKWYDMVLTRGYKDVLFDGLSRYFIHESHAERGEVLALSPNVFDGFHVQSTHFVAGYVASQHDTAIQTIRQQAAAEHQAEIAALNEQAEAARVEAITAAQTQAEAMVEGVRIELKARIGAGERLIAEAKEESLALAKELAQTAQRLAESEAGRMQAECQRDEARQQGKRHADYLENELVRLRADIAWREALLAQAIRLLEQKPNPRVGWSQRLTNFLTRMSGRNPKD